ncbi:rhomboid family intramembrane serine protease [Reinekea forsetii]|nr:rhomboid family intramembrane serine protease [Reinekea forsetii]
MIIFPTEKRLEMSRAPFVLIALILLNVFIYFTYQSGDNEKAGRAIESYMERNFLEQEYPIFVDYLKAEEDKVTLERVEQFYYDEQLVNVAASILMHTEFYSHLQRYAKSEFELSFYNEWRRPRQEIQDQFSSISSFSGGLISNDVSVSDLLSHQFLHGSVSHLLGNMVFLFIFGYAVEAAIGHLRFLVFYLVGGVFAGLAQVATHLDSGVPLVGASGAISGVMAMYLAVFRFKKIEFFYWILFFVGYFRAPALLILPFYIGKEIYSYMTAIDSNVAFMAHAGGFVAGAILIGVALILSPKLLDQSYLDEDQDFSPRQKALAKIYSAIDALRFDSALTQLNQLIQAEGLDYELANIRYNLNRVVRNRTFSRELNEFLTLSNLSIEQKKELAQVWQTTGEQYATLAPDELLKLGLKLLTPNNSVAAKSIHERLFQLETRPADLKLLTQKLMEVFAQEHDHHNLSLFKERYQSLTQEGAHGHL